MAIARGVGVVAGLVCAAGAVAQPVYEITRLGLTAPRNTLPGGSLPIQNSSLTTLVQTPQGPIAAGQSLAFVDSPAGLTTFGEAWGWSRATGVVAIGLRDAEHTSALGKQQSSAFSIGDSGLVAGVSERYVPGADATQGASAWVWSPALGTQSIGLVGPETVRADGFRESAPVVAGGGVGGGVVGGTSATWSATQAQSLRAWAWTQAQGTVRIGLFGPGFGDSEGREFSQPSLASASGALAGFSGTFAGGGSGRESWVWTATQGTRAIGLVDADHTNSLGLRNVDAQRIGAGGHVIGWSQRYFPGTQISRGFSAWVATPEGVTTALGFVDAEHTGATGERISAARVVNTSGVVAGESTRYQGVQGMWAGKTAWVQQAGTQATRIGLVDALHTRANGERVSEVRAINDAGVVAGFSNSYLTGVTDPGRSAWRWSAALGTQRLGLTTGGFVRSDGVTVSDVVGVSDAGDVAGTSLFFASIGNPRTRAWYFDSFTSITHPIVPNVAVDEAWWEVLPSVLTPDGFVFGNYVTGLDPLSRTFGWSVATGFFDLESTIPGGALPAGWAALLSVGAAPDAGVLAGSGRFANADGQAVYLLQVPTPGALALGCIAGCMAARRRRGAR